MMKRKNSLKYLIQRYLLGKANATDEARVDRYYQDIAEESDALKEQSPQALQEMESRMWANIVEQQQYTVRRMKRTRYMRWAAAVLLPFLLLGGYYWRLNSLDEIDLQEIGPGKLSANLIAENGQVYSLASVADLEQLEVKGIYRESDHHEHGMHEIVTPRGGYYQLQLPDGSLVWLNAATSIRFPANFEADKREVFLSGEAYFDVKHNADAPFVVHTNLQSTKVLGTRFNISSYQGQRTDVVTLVEGSVETSSKQNERLIMRPGHQAHIGEHIRYTAVENAADVAAWRDGEFYFDNTPMAEVMQMIGRWYDVEVDLENLPNNKLNGLVNRNVPLKQLLDLIEKTSNVKVIVKGNKLYLESNQNE